MKLYPFAAAIFDMDGTLCDNMPLHARAFVTFMQRYALTPPPPEVRVSLNGKRNSEIMPVLFGRALAADELERYAEEKEAFYRELLPGIAPIPGLTRLLDALDAHGIPAAVATSAPRSNLAPLLGALGLEGRFAAVTLGEEVTHGKPAPDIFLESARRLGVSPADCLVFEDAFAGVQAARAGGMRCVALATTHTPEELAAACAPDLVVPDFHALLELIPELRAAPRDA